MLTTRLERLKESLNIDFPDKDGELCDLLEVAESYTLAHCNLSAEEAEGNVLFDQAVILYARISFETGGSMIYVNGQSPMNGFERLVATLKRPSI